MKRQETLLLGGLPLPGWCGLLPGHGVGAAHKRLALGDHSTLYDTPTHSNIPTLGGSKEGARYKPKDTVLYEEISWMAALGWDTGLPLGNETCHHRHHIGCMEKSGTPGWRGEKLHVQNYAQPQEIALAPAHSSVGRRGTRRTGQAFRERGALLFQSCCGGTKVYGPSLSSSSISFPIT